MHFPSATYRIQTSPEFRLEKIKDIIPYLDTLGISTVYSAPFFQAREGSTHGYDVADPLRIGDQIGDEEIFLAITKDLKSRNMNWLQDIVPNHMVFSSQNPWISNVLELGAHSPYYEFFDINWLSDDKQYYGKVMMPFLGSPLEEVLSRHEIQLKYGTNGFYFAYFDHVFPLRAESYFPLLQKQSSYIKDQDPEEEITAEFISLLAELEKWHNSQIHKEQYQRWKSSKARLYELSRQSETIRNAIQQVEETTSRDWDTLNHLLAGQNFQLCWWKKTETEINYRRFFTVNDLICLNIQEPGVFREYHKFIKDLVDKKMVQGLRVDHVDGLFDPTKYLNDLRNLIGADTYLVVEKILEAEELMPDDWPIQGTSGYEFLASVNQLYTARKGEKKLTELYAAINNNQPAYKDLVYQNKMFILLNRMLGELNNLMDLLKKLEIIPYADTADDEKLKQALANLLAAFPVYRIYSNQLPLSDPDMKIIAEAFALAESKAPSLSTYFERLREVFNGVPDRDEQQNKNRLYFVMRCQQFTGPLAAKGVEDTTFYVYNRLISRNEVGDTPAVFGISIEDFHQKMQKRNLHSINTTATHDTKRGEDARLRINVLSEIADEWAEQYKQWTEINKNLVTKQAGKTSPDENDRYFLYQTLLGTYPLHADPEQEHYQSRLSDYMLKFIREAKRNTSWSSPNDAYEKAMASFTEKVLNHAQFMELFRPFAKKVAQIGISYSLGQVLLKVSAPGIPDIYQGTEYWDLSMVDPDNRRPVDYNERMNRMQQLERKFKQDPTGLIKELKDNSYDPAIKAFTLLQALRTRRERESFFLNADYQPVSTAGSKSGHVLSFLRATPEQQVLILVPLNITALDLEDHYPTGEACWQDTALQLAADSQGKWTNIFTNQNLELNNKAPVSQILKEFPVALLIKN